MKMDTCKTHPDGMHKPLDTASEPSISFLDMVKSMMSLAPRVTEGVMPSNVGILAFYAGLANKHRQADYNSHLFQPEQRLAPRPRRKQQSGPC